MRGYQLLHGTLEEVLAALRSYTAGDISRAALELSFVEIVLDPTERHEPPHSDEGIEAHSLAYLIREAFSFLDSPEEDAQLLASRVIQCWEEIEDPAGLLDLLPLIRHHDDFSVLVSKYRRGLIQQVGFQSIIAKRFPFDACREWLEAASLDRVEHLCNLLEGDHYRAALQLLQSEPRQAW